MGLRIIVALVALLTAPSAAQAQQNPLNDLLRMLPSVEDVLKNRPAPAPVQRTRAQGEDAGFSDVRYIQNAINLALESRRSGTETPWNNPSNGHHGVVIPSPAIQTGGKICRGFERTVVLGASTTTFRGTACREGNGIWKIREEARVPGTFVVQLPEPAIKINEPVAAAPGRSIAREAAQTTADQAQAKQGLINALEELEHAVNTKIDNDVEIIARAFADAYDIEQSRRIADFVRAPLREGCLSR